MERYEILRMTQQTFDLAMKIRRSRPFRWSPLLALPMSLVLLGCAQERSPDAAASKSAQQLFQSFCSGCHGADGRGAGPLDPSVSGQAPDLTLIAAHSGGLFPRERVFRTIDGQFDSPSPNAHHMPIWGYEHDHHQQVLDMEHSLVSYIESLQRPAPPNGGAHD
jgi:mono/diheme cytochrome c family protein